MNQRKRGKKHVFVLFLRFLSFSSVSDEKDKKLVLMQKQIILTSKRRAEHPFNGRNIQHLECGDLINILVQLIFTGGAV